MFQVVKILLKKPRNKFETRLYNTLRFKKIKFKYESEKIPYVIAGHYIPDFILVTPLGKIYVEAKGYLRPEHKRKMVAVKRQHPEIDLRILFYARKEKDIRWAERNGFKWAVDTFPQEWLEGF